MLELDTRRREIAELRFIQYDFDWEIKDIGGWEYQNPGSEWVRTVYFERCYDNGDYQDGPSIKGYFTVRFINESPVVAEEYAIVHGDIFGSPAEESDNTSEEIWQTLKNVPVDDNRNICEDFQAFSKGTHVEDIWRWLEQRDENFSIASAMGLVPISPI